MEKFFRPGLNTLLFIIVGCFCGCSPNNQLSMISEHHIVDHHVLDSLLSGVMINSNAYIALETVKNNIVGTVDKLKVFDDKLFILSENQVLVYDMSGKFLFKVNKSGRG